MTKISQGSFFKHERKCYDITSSRNSNELKRVGPRVGMEFGTFRHRAVTLTAMMHQKCAPIHKYLVIISRTQDLGSAVYNTFTFTFTLFFQVHLIRYTFSKWSLLFGSEALWPRVVPDHCAYADEYGAILR